MKVGEPIEKELQVFLKDALNTYDMQTVASKSSVHISTVSGLLRNSNITDKNKNVVSVMKSEALRKYNAMQLECEKKISYLNNLNIKL